MTSEEYVKSIYPEAFPMRVISNHYRRNIYVIVTGVGGYNTVTYHPHPLSKTQSSAWVNAKKFIKEAEIKTP